MDRIAVSSGDIIGVTNDEDVGPVDVSYTTGPARILRRPINHVYRTGRRRERRTSAPEVGKVYEFTVVPFALEFSLNADIGRYTCDTPVFLTASVHLKQRLHVTKIF